MRFKETLTGGVNTKLDINLFMILCMYAWDTVQTPTYCQKSCPYYSQKNLFNVCKLKYSPCKITWYSIENASILVIYWFYGVHFKLPIQKKNKYLGGWLILCPSLYWSLIVELWSSSEHMIYCFVNISWLFFPKALTVDIKRYWMYCVNSQCG